jgi:hypothetical protein
MESLVISPEAGRALFFLAVIVFVGWFAGGTLLNVRKGNAAARWIQEGLPLLGEKTTLRWLGSSGIEMKLRNPVKPLTDLQIFILLEPRDVPFLWAYFHWRGRRDILILRGQISPSPAFQLEAADPQAWSTRGAQAEAIRKRWSPLASPAGSRVAAYAEGRVEAATQLLALAAGCPLPLVRLAIRRTAPQLEVQWQLSGFADVSARSLFQTFHQLSEEL